MWQNVGPLFPREHLYEDLSEAVTLPLPSLQSYLLPFAPLWTCQVFSTSLPLLQGFPHLSFPRSELTKQTVLAGSLEPPL